ncbi:MAG: DNA adenine methylase [Kiritimatiellae bacterium]|nr:DNA adenine methylase [Kiritimatiellia bacterium]
MFEEFKLESEIPTPRTEGIKYAGSKLKLIPYILDIIGHKGFRTVLDGFSGTTRVSQAFAQIGMSVTANDISEWSQVFATCYLKSSKENAFYEKILQELNALPGVCGWFTENYGGGVNEVKKPFQRHNTERLDAIRNRIDELSLDWEDKCVVLSSLIFALDSVDSTLGHYAAYLNNWSPRSFNKMNLRLPRRFETDQLAHTVLRMDIFNAIQGRSFDAAYFDPPYGSNNEKMPPSRVRYGAYYHLWKTVVLNDRPRLFGKAGRREDSRDECCSSLFEEYRKDAQGRYIAIDAIDRLIREVQSDYVLLSYSSGGRATKQELMDSLSSNGTIETMKAIDYKKNVMADMRWTNEWINSDVQNQEYLFLLKK